MFAYSKGEKNKKPLFGVGYGFLIKKNNRFHNVLLSQFRQQADSVTVMVTDNL